MEPTITKIEIEAFNWERTCHGESPEGIPVYDPDATTPWFGMAVKIHTNAGVTGEYVEGGGDARQMARTARRLIGRHALERARFYDESSSEALYGRVDVALWDLAGKLAGLPIYRLLGGHRKKLPAYASTINGAKRGPLSTPESFADFAEQCAALGYKAFKIHPYPWLSLQKHVDTVRAVGRRVGDGMDLMLDAYCFYRTFAAAVTVGRACDEMGFFWYEDPYADGGVTHFSHNKLRQLIRTPLLQGEKMHGLAQRMNFILAKATDFIRGDVGLDGITGTLKLAHAAESVGLDLELHGGGPVERHVMAAIRNTNYCEIVWVHPDKPDYEPPIHLDGYKSGLYGVDESGCVDVPDGPGLGVVYDWEFIKAHSQGRIEVT